MKSYRESIFGKLGSQEILTYTFENDQGYRLIVMNYGATVVQYVTPDKDNHFDNIVVGFVQFEDYIGNSPKHGASIGPVAGRIAGAAFELNGQTFQLEANNGLNCNHSGSSGWDSSVFEVEEVSNDGLTFYTERTDGTGGFPGNLKIWVSYTLTEKGKLEISYQVQTDQDTLVNPTNHLRQQLRSSEVGVRGVQVLGDLEKTATAAARNLAVARALSWIPSGLLAIVAALAVSRVTRLLAITRETETLQLLGRGATGGQVLFANLVEAGVVALAGSLAGSGLAWVVLAFFGGVPVAPVLQEIGRASCRERV